MKQYFLCAAMAFAWISAAHAEEKKCDCSKSQPKSMDFIIEATVVAPEQLHKGWGDWGHGFSIKRLWKGPFDTSDVAVDGRNKFSECAIKFEMGKTYLIQGDIHDLHKMDPQNFKAGSMRLWTTPCYGTKPIEEVAERIKALGEPIKVFPQE